MVHTVARPRIGLVEAPLDGDTVGTDVLGTQLLRPGSYVVSLLDTHGAALAQMPFWVKPRQSKPHLHTTQRSYRRGSPVEITWTNAPGNRNDWLAVF